jgi:monoamine oxidase
MIEQLGYGTNAKVIGQFRSRVWLERQKASGTSITDLPVQASWDASRGQRGASGLLSVFLGGAAGLAAAAGSPDACMRGFLPDLDTIFPGTAAEYYDGSALRMHWPSMPFARGSYACYRPGQAAWSGRVGERVGHLHFCGEHTSATFQGYIEGAAESGERAAQELLSDLRLAAPPRRASHVRT